VPTNFDLAVKNSELQDYLDAQSHGALTGSNDWSVVSEATGNPSIMSSESADQVLASITSSLSIADNAAQALTGIEELSRKNEALIKGYVGRPDGSDLLSKILFLSESSDDQIASQASNLNLTIQDLLSRGPVRSVAKGSRIDVVQRGLREVSRTSVTVQTLVEVALDVISTIDDNDQASFTALLPDASWWRDALTPFLALPPRPQLAITSSLGGAVSLVRSETPIRVDVPRDSHGFSAALRIGYFITQVASASKLLGLVPSERLLQTYQLLSLTLSLANDNLGLAGANDLWSVYSTDTEQEMSDWVANTQRLLNTHLSSAGLPRADEMMSDNELLKDLAVALFESAEGTSPASYYNALSYTERVTNAIEANGWQAKHSEDLDTQLRHQKMSKDTLATIAFLIAHKAPLESGQGTKRYCNELVADLTGCNIEKTPHEGLRLLLLLNAILQHQEEVADSIAKQRVIFFVKHAVTWLQTDAVAENTQAEVLKALLVLLPQIVEIYGSHWTDIFEYLSHMWSSTESLNVSFQEGRSLALMYASLKLLTVVKRLTSDEECNDDLKDAWKEQEGSASRGLLNVLKRSQGYPDDYHQPLRIVNELLARQISQLPIQQLEEPSELYPLLFVDSAPVQQTAFDILHKQIPAVQEQVSLDVALEKKAARLPDELLSLILEAPTMEALEEVSFERTFPLPLRGYLLSWLLLFDHFSNSSYKVKSDYAEHVKEDGNMPGLLDFVTEFLGHSLGKPVDVSRFSIATYTADSVESPLRDAQYLLTHLYYLCLKHLPSLTKNWWIECKSRQKVIAVETWTEKYISPLVIADELHSVSEWAQTEDASADDAFTVKVSTRAKEVSAGYLVDEQTMTIKVKLPSVFPLRQALVEGVNRVAVDERKWQSWVRTTQGVIAFSVAYTSTSFRDYSLTHIRTITLSTALQHGGRTS